LGGSWSDGRGNGSEIVGYLIPLLVMHDAPVTVAQSLLQFCHFYSTTIFSSSSKNKEKTANQLRLMQVLCAHTINRKCTFKTKLTTENTKYE
jgi:hypothetical protein